MKYDYNDTVYSLCSFLPILSECFAIDPITLNPDPSSNDGLNRLYTPDPTFEFPILTSSGDAICAFELQPKCEELDPMSAPTCQWEISISLNKGATNCDPNAVGFRTGKISASGTGPAAYDVTGGAFDFRGAEGQFDSIFDTTTFQLSNFQTVGEVCYSGLDSITAALDGVASTVSSVKKDTETIVTDVGTVDGKVDNVASLLEKGKL